jgi:hypothetical protein
MVLEQLLMLVLLLLLVLLVMLLLLLAELELYARECPPHLRQRARQFRHLRLQPGHCRIRAPRAGR